jgi:hypothetical protein
MRYVYPHQQLRDAIETRKSHTSEGGAMVKRRSAVANQRISLCFSNTRSTTNSASTVAICNINVETILFHCITHLLTRGLVLTQALIGSLRLTVSAVMNNSKGRTPASGWELACLVGQQTTMHALSVLIT